MPAIISVTRSLGLSAGILLLTACASTAPVFHSEAQLNRVGAECGLAMGELVQEEDAQKLLFVIREAPSPAERLCIYRFADRNHLKPVIIDAITYAEE